MAAADKTFNLGDGPVPLSDVSSQVGVLFKSMRFVPGPDQWLVDVCLTNKSSVAVPVPLVMWVESFSGTTGPIGPDGTEGSNPAHAYYDFTAQTADAILWPGNRTGTRTMTLGYNVGAPSLVARVYARTSSLPSGLTLVRTLNNAGQPLPGVQVWESGPLGNTSKTSDAIFGLVTLGQTNGLHTWQFGLSGYLPVWRRQTLVPGEVGYTLSPRFTPRAEGQTVPMAGGVVSNSAARITVPAGAFAQDTFVTLTPLAAQTLPGLLPAGWSPLQAFWLESAAVASQPLVASVELWGPVYVGESAVLARWNKNSVAWEAQEVLPGPALNLVFTLPGDGAFGIIVADKAPWPPPTPVPGQPLAPASAPPADYTALIAGGRVEPSVSIASRVPERVTGAASLAITNGSGALPSGLPLLCEIGEQYEFRDGTVRRTPHYENFIVGYQRPGDATSNTLHASFPLRPILLPGPEALSRATVEAEVLPTGFVNRRVLGPGGGSVSVGPVTLVATPGSFASRQAIYIRPLGTDDLALLTSSNAIAVAGFDLGVTGVTAGKQLGLQVAGIPTNSLFVLARVLVSEELFGLEPVERLASHHQGSLSSLEPAAGERLPGVVGAGQFVLAQVAVPQGLIGGIARDAAGQPAANLPVWVEGQPWLTFSGNAGKFQLVAPTGAARVSVSDPGTGDTGQTTIAVVAPDVPVDANPAVVASGPRVISLTPTNGATDVAQVTPVVVRFSEPVNPATLLPAGVQLLDTNDQPVTASVALNLQNTAVTLLPVAQLPASSLFTIRIAATVADLTGLPIEGPRDFSFTTRSDALNRVPAQLVSHEPVNGVAAMVGSPGTAEPESPVILVNETTGQTATILSKPDGSFSNSIPADVDDFLSAVLVNLDGTRNSIPVSRQLFRDGTVGLFNGGGILEAQSDGGPLQIIVEPGTIPTKTKFKLETLPLSEILASVGNTQPEGGQLLGGFRYSQSGDALAVSPDVSFPIPEDQLGLPPGTPASQASFALAIPRVIDGVTAYEIIDRLHYENGALVTHSPPFLGLLVLPFFDISSTAVVIKTYEASSSVINGHVLAGEVDAAGELVDPNRARRLNGATVRAFVGSTIQQPGRISAGTLFATAYPANATYSILIPFAPSNPAATIQALHPDLPGQIAQRSIVLSTHLPAYAADLVFHVTDPEEEPDLTPPTPAISHNPFYVQPGSTTMVQVVCTDNLSRPSVDLAVDQVTSLVSNLPLALETVTLTETNSEEFGTIGIRKRYELNTTNSARVVLRVTAKDQATPVPNSITAYYTVDFGAGAVSIANAFEPADTNDVAGPTVVWSSPSQGSSSWVPGQPIVLQFSEAVDRALLANPGWFKMSPATSDPTLSLSDDQRELSLFFHDLAAGSNSYTLTVSSGVTDLNENPLDSDPTTPDADSFELTFTSAAQVTNNLPGMEFGGGIVTKGSYVYALERRGSLDGAVVVYDLRDLSAPVEEFSVPGYPRELLLIPSYAYHTNSPAFNPDARAQTNDLLVVAGGIVGQRFGQYLWVINLSDPTNLVRVASTPINAAGNSAVTKLRWSPPVLGYLEIGAVSSISTVHLQNFILGLNLSAKEFDLLPAEGNPGKDANGDGDYVDDGDELPLPPRLSLDFAGKLATHALSDSDQLIADFAMEDSGEFIGLMLREGRLLTNGLPAGEMLDDAYRTLYFGGLELPRELASYPFVNARALRVTPLFGYPLTVTNEVAMTNDLLILNLALVSVDPDDSTLPDRIAVLDVTDPTDVTLINEILIPTQFEGPVYSILRRDDGLLAVALKNDVLLLDPDDLGLVFAPGSSTDQVHPAIVGRIPGAGTTAHSFFSSPTGLSGVSLGGKNQLIQTGPSLSFVWFLDRDPFDPSTNASLAEAELQQLLAEANDTGIIWPARYKSESGVVDSTLDPPNPQTHFYVLVRAPGAAGSSIDLALETLNWARAAEPRKGFLFPPVHSLSPATLASMEQTPNPDEDAPVSAARAWRMSADPASDFYNLFISRPIALVHEEIAKEDLAALKTSLDREILWSGRYLRASLDPSMAGNAVLGRFASSVDSATKSIRPGVSAFAQSVPADTIHGPNPAPIRGAAVVFSALGMAHAHNRSLTHSSVDFTLQGRRLSIEFRRFYNGQALHSGVSFGRGWDFNYNQRVIELSEELFLSEMRLPQVLRDNLANSEVAEVNDLLVVTGTGRNLVYKHYGKIPPQAILNDPLAEELGWTYWPESYYLPPAGMFNFFVRFTNGCYARLEVDGTQVWFNPDGRLEKIYDRFPGNFLQFIYNEEGHLMRITNAPKSYLDIGYWRRSGDPHFRNEIDMVASAAGAQGRICRLRDHTGRDVLYDYYDDGQLKEFQGPKVDTVATAPGLPASFTGRKTTSYYYSDASLPGKTAKSLVRIVSGDPDGTSRISLSEHDASAGRDTIKGLTIGHRAFTYEATYTNKASAIAKGGTTMVATADDGETTTYTFDTNGRPVVVVLSGPSATDATLQRTYDTNGLLLAVVLPEGNTNVYVYDTGNPSLRSRGNLLRTERYPGIRGGLVLVATNNYDARYQLPSGYSVDFNRNVTYTQLSPDKRVVETITTGGDQETFDFNEFGQIARHTALDGTTRAWTYYSDSGFLETESKGVLITRYYYSGLGASERGLPSSSIDPKTLITNYTYNERDQIVEATKEGSVVRYTYDVNSYATGQARKVETGPLERWVVYTTSYNQFGFMTSQSQLNVEVDGIERSLTTQLEPDNANRLDRAILPNGEVHRFTYDHMGRIIRQQVGTDFIEEYGYDRNGNRTGVTNSTAKTAYQHDGHDRVISVTMPNGLKIETVYDGNGNATTNRLLATDETTVLQETRTTFDHLNRTRQIVHGRDGGMTIPEEYDYYTTGLLKIVNTDPFGASHSQEYDTAGRITKLTLPTQVIVIQPDGNGNVQFRTSTYQPSGRVLTEDFEYNGRDQLTSAIINNDLETRYDQPREPGLDGRVFNIRDPSGNTAHYSYTRLGKVASETDENGVTLIHQYDTNRNESVASPSTFGGGITNTFGTLERLEKTVLPNGQATVLSSFNGLNLPETILHPRGITETRAYDDAGRIRQLMFTGLGSHRIDNMVFDELDRLVFVAVPNSSVTNEYDKLGFVKSTTYKYGSDSFSLGQTADDLSRRLTLTYPSGLVLNYTRRVDGRVSSLENGISDPIINSTDYEADLLIRSRKFGVNLIKQIVEYDSFMRPMKLQYSRISDGVLLAEVRYVYSHAGIQKARQFIHRGGRADFFAYDNAYRLIRADIGVRPGLGGDDGAYSLSGFGVPAEVNGAWKPGFYAREYSYYADSDLLQSASELKLDHSPAPPFAASYTNPDAMQHVDIDGDDRNIDEAGNVTNTWLTVRLPGQAAFTKVAAGLLYNELNQMTRVEREDGVAITNVYGPTGLRIRRIVAGPVDRCVPSDLAFIYDGELLIEERDLSQGGSELVGRYYYPPEGDVPLAADLRVPGGDTNLFRRFFLTDVQGSVLAVADDVGRIMERVTYDAWGTPQIQGLDEQWPEIRQIVKDTGDSFLVVFSEAVLPPLTTAALEASAVSASLEPLGSAFLLELDDGTPVSSTIAYDETATNYVFGSVVRISLPNVGSTNVVLRLAVGNLVDEWGNPNQAATVTLTNAGTTPSGTVAYNNPGASDTSPPALDRSAIGLSFLFHGQVFDCDAGLLYLRARFYDPSIGLFLQPDPYGFEDSANLYAAFANNPVSNRDPTGAYVSGLITLSFIAWDTSQFLLDNISAEEYAVRMGINALSLAADAASGGLGGGMAVRTAAMAGRAGRVGQFALQGLKLYDRYQTVDAAVQSAISFHEAASHDEWGRAAISAAQLFFMRKQIGGDAMTFGKLLHRRSALKAAPLLSRRASRFIDKAADVQPEWLWRAGVPGIQTMEISGYWLKRVDPRANRFLRWWGQRTINAQHRGLQSLGDMATPHRMSATSLITKDVGPPFTGGRFSMEMLNPTVLKAYLKGSWRMKTPLNDIIPRNMGREGLIFDPSLDWFTVALAGGGAAGVGYAAYELFNQ